MPAGLQVFDSSGNLVLDVTDRLCMIVGEFKTGTSDGSFSVPNGKGDPFFYITPETVRVTGQEGTYRMRLSPWIVWNATTRIVSWTFDAVAPTSVPRQSCRILLGFY